jgi:hypothetical protein
MAVEASSRQSGTVACRDEAAVALQAPLGRRRSSPTLAQEGLRTRRWLLQPAAAHLPYARRARAARHEEMARTAGAGRWPAASTAGHRRWVAAAASGVWTYEMRVGGKRE